MEIIMPFLNTNDSSAILTNIYTNSNCEVEKGQIIASFETTKSIIDIDSPEAGWIIWNYSEGDIVDFGSVLAILHASKQVEAPKTKLERSSTLNITKKAQALIDEHNIDVLLFNGKEIILERDVLELLNKNDSMEDQNLEAVDIELISFGENLNKLLTSKRLLLKKLYDRHVPLGTILNDRWSLAESLGFGKNSSVYDESLVIGDVCIGENCWVGPFTVLDGSGGGLKIGDWTSIGAGTHVYTHHTINKALTGGKANTVHLKTEIGCNCFISPNVIVSPGARIGNQCFIAANSFVEGIYPDNSFISGSPAKVVGKVIVDGIKVRYAFF